MKQSIRKLLYHINNRNILINGTKRKIPSGMYNQYSLTKNNIVENHLVGFLKKYVNNGHTFVDIGANVGWVSIEVSSIVGENGKVYSFEPIKSLCKLFDQLVELNNIKNIFLINAAVGEIEKFAEINVSEIGSAFQERSSLIQEDPNGVKQEILVLQIDRIFKNKKIDFIKIDVEGFEKEVLNGAIQTIENYRPIVLLEAHGLYFENPDMHVKKIYDYFNSKNYYAVNIINHEITNYSDFVKDTLIEGNDPLSGKELKYLRYGQLAFIPEETSKNN